MLLFSLMAATISAAAAPYPARVDHLFVVLAAALMVYSRWMVWTLDRIPMPGRVADEWTTVAHVNCRDDGAAFSPRVAGYPMAVVEYHAGRLAVLAGGSALGWSAATMLHLDLVGVLAQFVWWSCIRRA